MKIQITSKNRQLILEMTMDDAILLVKPVRFLLNLRYLDRLSFIRSLDGLLLKAILLVLNLTDGIYKPFIVAIVEIVCKSVLKHGPPACFSIMS